MPRHVGFFLADGPVGESVGNRVVLNPKSRVDLEKMFTSISISHGHYGVGNSNSFVCWLKVAFSGQNRVCPDDEK